MKHLKLFEQKSYEGHVAKICRKYKIKNWDINSEGLVDVDDDDVWLNGKVLTKLPLDFGHVSGDFYCDYNDLASLEGCPRSVGGSFYCSNNKLTSLEGCPQEVRDDFYCSNNKLTSLEGCPQEVRDDFYCYDNKLTSLKGCPQSVGGHFSCYNNQLTSLRFAPEEVGGKVYILPNPITDIPKKYLTNEYLEFIVKEQNNDWRLYRKDGSIYPERLKQMIEWGIETNKIKPI
jgi:hypothetical protein